MKKQLLLVLSFFGAMTFAQHAKSNDVAPKKNVATMRVPDKPTLTSDAYYQNSNPQQLSNPMLYNQTMSVTDNISSQQFEAANTAYNSMAADDFTVPAADTWSITDVFVKGSSSGSVYPTSFNVVFYNNSGTNLPGTIIRSENVVLTAGSNSPTLPLATPLLLGPGTYWISVQAVLDFTGGGQWYWDTYTAPSTLGSPYAWTNPGGGFGTTCTGWNTGSVCIAGQLPDLQFALNGTIATATVCKTLTGRITAADPTQSPRIFRDGIPSTCATPKTYPGDFSSGNFHYDSYNLTNTSASPECVTFNLTNPDANGVHLVAYNGTFNPANIGANYLADTGSSSLSGSISTMSVTIPAGGTIVLVASEPVASSTYGADYTIDVISMNCGVILKAGEVGGRQSVSLYPNPTAGTLFVNGMNVSQVKVTDASGKLIPVKNAGNQINVEKLPKGTYILQLQDKNGNTHSDKFIKK